MKLKVTLAMSGQRSADLLATVDAGTTVGDLAAYLARAISATPTVPPGERPTLTLHGNGLRTLDPRATIADSSLHSGTTVSLSRAGTDYQDSGTAGSAVVTILSGPDAGREFQIGHGTNVIGRERGCEILLSDEMVSRQHARLNVTDSVEIVDLGSANGVAIGDAVVARATIRPGDVVRIGDTDLTVRLLRPLGGGPETEGTTVAFIRSPRLDPRYKGATFVTPEPPEAPGRSRFPIVPLIVPVLMGGLLFALTRSTTSLIFVALSPAMLIGNGIESRLAGRAMFKKALALWRSDLADLVEEATRAQHAEQVMRNREHPPLQEVLDAARSATPLLWSRRPADPGFAELKLGSGRQPSRNTVELPEARRVSRELFAEATQATAPFAFVDNVPVLAEPAEAGGIGIAGARATMLGVARAVVLQAAVLHSPAELIIAGLASSDTARDWDWVKWLPHTSSSHSPVTARLLASSQAAAAVLLSELEELIERRAANKQEPRPIPTVLLVVESDAPAEHSRLVELAEVGWRCGVYVLWVAGDTTQLPAACRTFVETTPASTAGAIGYVHRGEQVAPVELETIAVDVAAEVARRLAPMVDVGARVDDESDLPRAVSLLALTGTGLANDPATVIERWSENRSIVRGPRAPTTHHRQAGTLRAVVGQAAGEPLAIDLRVDGPHALVGGTTGSGKSELLQAWILAMAAAHSPHRLTFLLVDYKGGSAFRDCVSLPHTVGLVTDLSPHLVRRALTSLAAELHYRERLLDLHSAKDLETLEKRGVADTPPSLVIVVDEFAALVSEVPEFVDGVVNVAQRGRSLGLHLILATQRPAGVIKDNLRANTNLRLALRVADEADSTDVLGTPQAAFFDPAIPGRAVMKTGPGRLVPFQTGYAGGWTSDETPPPEIAVEQLLFGAGQKWEPPESDEPVGLDHDRTDIKRLVTAIGQASVAAAIEPPRKPWLPDLRGVYDLADQQSVPSRRRDTELVFGIKDDPEHQAQPTIAFYPDRDGNLAVFGTGGAGKSTLLRTLAIAAGFTVRGGPCHVYGLDFGARGLSMLEQLPHVGSVIPGSDDERVARVLTQLRAIADDRALRYSRVNVGSVAEYRAATNSPNESRILLLVDGIAAFRQAYEVGDRAKWFDMLVGLATDGRPLGIHLIVSADRPAAIPSVLASAIQRRVVLRMADPMDYTLMGMPPDVLVPSSPPGRGMVDADEIQVAVLCRSELEPAAASDGEPVVLRTWDVGAQAEAVRSFAESMRRAGVADAPPIQRLADRVALRDLPETVGGEPTFGLSGETLQPLGLTAQGSFLICGPPGSGRTTATATVVSAVRRTDPGVASYLIAGRRTDLGGLNWNRVALGPDAAIDLALELIAELGDGVTKPPVVVIENVGDFVGGPAEQALQDLAKCVLDVDGLFVAEGETTTLTSSYGLLGYAKASRAGIALQPDSADGATVYRTNFPPRLARSTFPVGRGLHVAGGKTTLVQVAE